MTAYELQQSPITAKAKELIINRAEKNYQSYGTPIEDSIRIQYNTLVRTCVFQGKFFVN